MDKKIQEQVRLIRARARGRATGFAIGTTAGAFTGKFWTTPMRETKELIYGGVIALDAGAAAKVARMVDGKVGHIFVDAEMKVKGIERAVARAAKKSKVITYEGNAMTSAAVDALIAKLAPDIALRTVALIGMGNLGSKIALNLIERGARVRAYRRGKVSLHTVVKGLNEVRLRYSAKLYAAKNQSDACKGASIVVASTNVKGSIDAAALKGMSRKQPRILIDVGKGCFTDEVARDDAYTIYRLDVSMQQKHLFAGLVETDREYSRKLGRRRLAKQGITLVSPGILARQGEVIVDDLAKPTRIIGISDGKGALEHDSGKYKNILRRL